MMNYKSVFLATLSFPILSSYAFADCTEEQRARMIKNDISQENIDKLCSDDSNKKDESVNSSGGTNINININNESSAESESSSESSSSSKSASQDGNTSDKKFKYNVIGLGSYSLTQSYSYTYSDGYFTYTENVSNNYSGANIFYQRNLNEHFAISAKSYSVSDDINDIEGVTGTLWLGSNFGRIGWNFAVGLGGYTEEWEDESFSGAEVGLRLGYQWEDWHLYLAGFSRSTSDQEDVLRDAGFDVDDYTHSTGAFNLGYRF